MIDRPLAWLLGLANAGAVGLIGEERRQFYALKERLLRRYGFLVGEDIQHIVDRCWGDYQEGCIGRRCPRCGGSGIWRERYVVLERWELAGRVFHRPTNEVRWSARSRVTIEGRIEHRDVNVRAASEAQLWLALLFDRRTFWLLLTRSRYVGWQWRPMLALQAVSYGVRISIHKRIRQCWSCRRRYLRLGDATAYNCQRCTRRVLAAIGPGGDDDLPF